MCVCVDLQSSLELVGSFKNQTRVAVTINQTPLVHHIVRADSDQ